MSRRSPACVGTWEPFYGIVPFQGTHRLLTSIDGTRTACLETIQRSSWREALGAPCFTALPVCHGERMLTKFSYLKALLCRVQASLSTLPMPCLRAPIWCQGCHARTRAHAPPTGSLTQSWRSFSFLDSSAFPLRPPFLGCLAVAHTAFVDWAASYSLACLCTHTPPAHLSCSPPPPPACSLLACLRLRFVAPQTQFAAFPHHAVAFRTPHLPSLQAPPQNSFIPYLPPSLGFALIARIYVQISRP